MPLHDFSNPDFDSTYTVSSSGTSLTVTYATADVWDITLTGACTLTLSGTTSGVPNALTLILRQDGTGSRTVTWPGSVSWLGGRAPILQTIAASVDVVTLFTVNGGTNWYGFSGASAGQSGTEIGYDQITSNVTVSSTTESSGTAVINAAAHVFNGSPVIAEFSSPVLAPNTGDAITICLFEGATEITRFCNANVQVPVVCRYRFSPSAGSHTYSVTAFHITGTATVFAGTGGTGAYAPAYLRFSYA